MKQLFLKYKSVLRFVVLFLGTYLALTVVYSAYLGLSKDSQYPPDFITNLVARQSSTVLDAIGYTATVAPHKTRPTMKLFVEGEYLAHIIEGCNSMSIIVLFISFIVAFAQQWRKTLLYILAGSVLIYGINVIRIAVLAVALYTYPEYQHILHGVVFPGMIYGMVFLLWMVWVKPYLKNQMRMSRIIKIGLALVLLVLLVLLRAYESELFYDPLIQFFETSHTTEVLPPLDFAKLVLHTTLRFLLNTLLSLAMLWILFQKREIVKVAAILYGVVFILLLIVFVFLVHSEQAGGHLALFYVRRFLIQPIFLLLLIPAFYFQKKA